jgi:hypothetical protein
MIFSEIFGLQNRTNRSILVSEMVALDDSNLE